MQSIDNYLIIKIKKAKMGSLFFSEDFLFFGLAKALVKALEKLVLKEMISPVARDYLNTVFF